jgi:hypothetical protein
MGIPPSIFKKPNETPKRQNAKRHDFMKDIEPTKGEIVMYQPDNTCQHNHDRFLIIDDVVYLFGASLKDAGKKLFAYIRMQETPASEIIGMIR